jgi:hypothetical protein
MRRTCVLTRVWVDASVVNVPTSQIAGTANEADLLEQVFNIEKKLALDLFTQLGVTLTPAERNQIEQRPTRSLAAFVAYSSGLRAEDEGRYDDAGRYFNEAIRIDPGFGAAQQKGQEVTAVVAGATVTAATVEAGLKGTSEGSVVTAAKQGSPLAMSNVPALGSSAQSAAADLNPSASGAATGGAAGGGNTTPSSKNAVAAGTGSDNPSATATVNIVITRPKP